MNTYKGNCKKESAFSALQIVDEVEMFMYSLIMGQCNTIKLLLFDWNKMEGAVNKRMMFTKIN